MDYIILYHANCMDGLGAAWAAKAALPKLETPPVKDSIHLLPVNYGEPFPDLPGYDKAFIYILDVSYPAPVLKDVAARPDVTGVQVIDHHPTADASLKDVRRVSFGFHAAGLSAIIDESQSAAVLAWKHFHKDQPLPDILNYIQDRDLWNFDLPDSKEINAAIYAMAFNDGQDSALNSLNWIAMYWHRERESFINSGMGIRMHQRILLHDIAATAGLQVAFHSGKSSFYASVNSSVLRSEVGDLVLKQKPNADFVDVWYDDRQKGIRRHSLRSRKGSSVDVSAIAVRLGGGGHKHAAGYSENLNDLEP